MAVAQTGNALAFVFIPKGFVYSHMTIIFAFDEYRYFALLQSSIHLAWIIQTSSTLKGDARYSPTDTFGTFPFPNDINSLEEFGFAYYEARKKLMLGNQQGLTKIYNQINSPDNKDEQIVNLRNLHIEIDRAVCKSYGWDDISLEHDFLETPFGTRFTISDLARNEILNRLINLNATYFEFEQRQAQVEEMEEVSQPTVDADGSSAFAPPMPGQLSFFDDEEADDDKPRQMYLGEALDDNES